MCKFDKIIINYCHWRKIMKLSKKNLVIISFMLFSLFFGAGNLIFPPLLGQQSGSNTFLVLLDF